MRPMAVQFRTYMRISNGRVFCDSWWRSKTELDRQQSLGHDESDEFNPENLR